MPAVIIMSEEFVTHNPNPDKPEPKRLQKHEVDILKNIHGMHGKTRKFFDRFVEYFSDKGLSTRYPLQ